MRRLLLMAVALALAMASASFAKTAAPPGTGAPQATAISVDLTGDISVAMALGACTAPITTATTAADTAKHAAMMQAALDEVTHPIKFPQVVTSATSAGGCTMMKTVFYREVTHPIKACTGAFVGIIGHDMGTTSTT